MNKIHKMAASALVALSVTAVAANASATQRPVCEGRDATSLRSGAIIGATIVDQVWASVGENPDEVDTFRRSFKRIVRSLVRNTLRGGASSFVKCRAQGLLDGAKTRLKEIQEEVRDVCIIDGTFWGEFSAELYCDLAVAFDGLEFLDLEFPELQRSTCGRAFERSCRSTYTQATEDICPVFTVDPYTEAYQENRRLSCTYVF